MSKTMLSDKIITSDAFLDMPLSAQALYVHLCMSADNDGFTQPKKIMRMVNAANDDLQILIAKRFILAFDSGVVVIKHWWINNSKRGDRHNATKYTEEYELLIIKENKAYTYLQQQTGVVEALATTGIPNGNHLATKRQPNTIQFNTTQSKAIQSNTIQPTVAQSVKPTSRPERIPTDEINEILEYWGEVIKLELGNETGQRKAIAALVRQRGAAGVKKLIDGVALSMDDQYAPRISDFVSLKRKQNDLLVWGHKKGKNGAAARF